MTDAPPGHTPFMIWNRSGNRAVAMLIRSPLHRLVSGQLLLITVTGRRTGRKHTLPVGYQMSAQQLTIPVLWPQRKLWWRNLRDGAPVELLLRGAHRTGQAQADVDEGEASSFTSRSTPRAEAPRAEAPKGEGSSGRGSR